jgi:3-keto-5-aminohexanoate cleavage enzyme
MDKLIITAAVTGSITTKEQSKYLPMTPQAIADEACRVYDEGATVVHLHARHPDRSRSDVDVLGETIQLIRERCPIITEVGTGIRERFGRIREGAERLELLDISPSPERETINAGTFSFQVLGGKTPPDGESGRVWTFHNPPDLIAAFIKGMKERKIGMEFEAYDVGHLLNIKRMVEWGALDPDEHLHINIVTGIGGGIDCSVKSIVFMVDNLPPNSSWCLMGVGRHQYPVTALGIVMGGHVRVGMEDNIYVSRGVLAKSNAELVAKAVRIAKDLGRDIASVDEARVMLDLK